LELDELIDRFLPAKIFFFKSVLIGRLISSLFINKVIFKLKQLKMCTLNLNFGFEKVPEKYQSSQS